MDEDEEDEDEEFEDEDDYDEDDESESLSQSLNEVQRAQQAEFKFNQRLAALSLQDREREARRLEKKQLKLDARKLAKRLEQSQKWQQMNSGNSALSQPVKEEVSPNNNQLPELKNGCCCSCNCFDADQEDGEGSSKMTVSEVDDMSMAVNDSLFTSNIVPLKVLKANNQKWVWDLTFSADSQYVFTGKFT